MNINSAKFYARRYSPSIQETPSSKINRWVSTASKRKRSTENQVRPEPVEPLKEEIEKLKVELAKKEEEIKDLQLINNLYKLDLTCIICRNYMLNPCTTICGHSFCSFCILKWLKEKDLECPLCRANIPTCPVPSYVLKDQVATIVKQLPPDERDSFEKEYKDCQKCERTVGMFEKDGVTKCLECGWDDIFICHKPSEIDNEYDSVDLCDTNYAGRTSPSESYSLYKTIMPDEISCDSNENEEESECDRIGDSDEDIFDTIFKFNKRPRYY